MKQQSFCIGLTFLFVSHIIAVCIPVNSPSTFNYLNTLLMFETRSWNYFNPDGK